MCRLCNQHEETIDHLTTGCPILAKNECLMSWCTFTLFNTQSTRHRNNRKMGHTHTHTPNQVRKYKEVTVLWNQDIHTEREVMTNRPDIIIKNTKEKIHI